MTCQGCAELRGTTEDDYTYVASELHELTAEVKMLREAITAMALNPGNPWSGAREARNILGL